MNDSPAMPCPLCHSARWEPWVRGSTDYISGETFDVLRCLDCGLGVTSPLPTGSLEKYYGPRYRTDRHGFTDRWRLRRRVAEAIRPFGDGFRGTVIDIGAGDGGFARAMRDAGWRVIATEYGDDAVARLLKQGLDARPSEGLDLTGERVDLVTLWHVLEHMPDPAPLLRQVCKAMHRESALQISVPNVDSWQARLTGRGWLHLDVPRHLLHFTPATLGCLLESCGFWIDRTHTLAMEYDWFGFIQSPMNAVTRQNNVLFERLTGGQWPACATRDKIASVLLAAPLAVATLPATLLSGLFGWGATLTVTARL